MQMYVNKNNQQLGPFEEAKVLEMLTNGQLSPNDMGIRNGESEWQSLNNLFPSVILTTPQSISPTVNEVKQNGCRRPLGTIMLILGLLLFIGGFFFPLKGALSGGQNLACKEAEKAKREADFLFEDFQRVKGTSAEPKKAAELKQAIETMQSWGKTCSEINASYRQSVIFLILMGCFGFVMAIIGFFVRRVKKF